MRNKGKNMVLAAVLSVVLGVSLIGCGSTSKQENNVQQENDEKDNNVENGDEILKDSTEEDVQTSDESEEDAQTSNESEEGADTGDSFIVYDYTGLEAFWIGEIAISQMIETDREVITINDATVMRGNDSSYPVGYIPKGTVITLSGYRLNPISHTPDSLQILNPISGTEDEYLYLLPEDVETVDGGAIEE